MPITGRTGIRGFDEIIGGGWVRDRTTLLVRGPGFGKTILALQFLEHGVGDCKEPGIFVARKGIADFGFGFVSLKYVSRLPLDTLKDRPLVRERHDCRAGGTGAGVRTSPKDFCG